MGSVVPLSSGIEKWCDSTPSTLQPPTTPSNIKGCPLTAKDFSKGQTISMTATHADDVQGKQMLKKAMEEEGPKIVQ